MLKNELQQSIHKYAEMALRVGLNLQHGQRLIIEAPIHAVSFVRIITELAYKFGASQVHFEWYDDELTLNEYQHLPEDMLGYYPKWKTKGLESFADDNATYMVIQSPNPDLLKGIPENKLIKGTNRRSASRKPFLAYTYDNRISWVIVNVPSVAWASKVFPKLEVNEGVTQLWDSIFRATHIDLNDPVENWEKHLDQLEKKCKLLNEMEIDFLHFRASGTDLVIELPEKHKWLSAKKSNKKGTVFVSNIPTEEVFTMPAKDGVNGIVRSTKPLIYGGALIEDFTLTFKDGRIVDLHAKNGEDILRSLLDTDDGARYLGEVALVPYHSPISLMGINFYNTLYDENASSHLAIGQSFSFNLEGGETMTAEDLKANRANNSLVHVDFMIGSEELSVDANLKNGTQIPLFRQGDWCKT